MIRKHRADNRLSVSVFVVIHVASLSGDFWVSYRSQSMVHSLFGLVILRVKSLMGSIILFVFILNAVCFD